MLGSWGEQKRGSHSWSGVREEEQGECAKSPSGLFSGLPWSAGSFLPWKTLLFAQKRCFLGRCVHPLSHSGLSVLPSTLCRGVGGHSQWGARSPGPRRNKGFPGLALELVSP